MRLCTPIGATVALTGLAVVERNPGGSGDRKVPR